MARETLGLLFAPLEVHRYLKLGVVASLLLATWVPAPGEAWSLVNGDAWTAVLRLLGLLLGRPAEEVEPLLGLAWQEMGTLLAASVALLVLLHLVSLQLSSVAAFVWVEGVLGSPFQIGPALRRHFENGTRFFGLRVAAVAVVLGSAAALARGEVFATAPAARLAWAATLWALVEWLEAMVPPLVLAEGHSVLGACGAALALAVRHPGKTVGTLAGLLALRVAAVLGGCLAALVALTVAAVSALVWMLPLAILTRDALEWVPSVDAGQLSWSPTVYLALAGLATVVTAVGYVAVLGYLPVAVWKRVYTLRALFTMSEPGSALKRILEYGEPPTSH